jgi:hypothetical protein
MNRLFVILWLCLAFEAFGHVGSPNVFFEGDAGAYPIRVIIRPPRVVPGLADISVQVKTNGVNKVSVLPARWDTGRKGSPPPDIAEPVKGETNLYSSQLWLMNSGAYSVFVNIEGAAGPGTAIVPINAIATQRLDMPRWMSAVFLAFGIFLFISLAALVGVATREGSLPIGNAVEPRNRRRGQIATAIAIVIASALLLTGKRWWDHVDRNFHANRLYEPAVVTTRVENNSLILQMPKKRTNRYDDTALVPDHGKLMHLFLVEEKTGGAFAHLHPIRHGSEFVASLPPLRAGKYHVYADVTHESGFNQTWLSTIDLPDSKSAAEPLDKDDAFAIIDTPATIQSPKVTLPNSSTIAWEPPATLKADTDTTLRFNVRRPDGSIALLEPYLGMYAHAVIWKEDGKVFTHLHPLGTISMTSQLLFARREQGERMANQPLDIICGAPPKDITFPYAFPEPGAYRIWVQIKIANEIQTASFTANVL